MAICSRSEVESPPELSLTRLSEQQDTVLSHSSPINNTVLLFSLLLSHLTVSSNGQVINKLWPFIVFFFLNVSVSWATPSNNFVGRREAEGLEQNKMEHKMQMIVFYMHTNNPTAGNNQLRAITGGKKCVYQHLITVISDVCKQNSLLLRQTVSIFLLLNLYFCIHRENELSANVLVFCFFYLSRLSLWFICSQEATTVNSCNVLLLLL